MEGSPRGQAEGVAGRRRKAPRRALGRDVLEHFLHARDTTPAPAAHVAFESSRHRDDAWVSLANVLRREPHDVWVRKHEDDALLIIDLRLAPEDVLRQYEASRRRSRSAEGLEPA